MYKNGLYRYLRKGTVKKSMLQDMYMNMITLVAADLHNYKTPDFNKYNYETSLNTGVAAFYRCPVKASVNYNKYCLTPAKPAAVIDNMGIAKRITTFGSDYSLEMEVDNDCILIYNNSALYPDYLFTHFAVKDSFENGFELNGTPIHRTTKGFVTDCTLASQDRKSVV